MPIIVVGGTGKCAGKTALICGIIAALPEFPWTAAKISSHTHKLGTPSSPLGAPSFPRLFAERVGDHEPPPSNPLHDFIWEETAAGQGTDTARFLAAGARRAILITASEPGPTVTQIQAALGTDSNVIFESNRVIDFLQPDICIAVIGHSRTDVKPSFQPFLLRADAIVTSTIACEQSLMNLGPVKPIFRLVEPAHISPEMLAWLRLKLHPPLRS